MNDHAKIELKKENLCLSGPWTAKGISPIQKNPLGHIIFPTFPIIIDTSQVSEWDSVGAWLMDKIIHKLREKNIKFTIVGLNKKQQQFLSLLEQKEDEINFEEPPKPKLNIFARLGKFVESKLQDFSVWMSFIGEFAVTCLRLLKNPLRIRWKYLLSVIELMGFRAMPIVAFLSFLIGVVLTYQIGLELKLYGANIYIVSLLGIAVFREFGPLVTAIILSGRTASSFTAQLGLMKVNEEIDALQTMGASPSELLTFPRIVGLILLMPLLTVWSDIFGMLGGMMMSNMILGINFHSFMEQIPSNITLTTFLIGLFKAPVFAAIIASVGCYQGYRVAGGADSIGLQTTKSVVLSIFLIIIADSIFSVLLGWWNI